MAMKSFQSNKSIHCSKKCWSKYIDDKLECDCGNNIRSLEWFWEEDEGETNFLLDPTNFIVTFHPIYSNGTSVVRGNKPLIANMHYYWELEIVSKLYGTDVMIGVGTKQGLQNFSNYRFRFCSMLGLDDQTWGYSYHGKIQHNTLIRSYGEGFGLSSKLGVHLDMCQGKLEYYINRKPLGVAFCDLKDKELYPIACATAAQSSMKLICSVSQEETLQMLCLKSVLQSPYLYEKYCSIPGLYKLYSKRYFWMTPKIKTSISREQEEEDLHILAMNNNSGKRKQKINHLVSAKKKLSHANSARPLRMDLNAMHSSNMVRNISNCILDPSDDSDDSS